MFSKTETMFIQEFTVTSKGFPHPSSFFVTYIGKVWSFNRWRYDVKFILCASDPFSTLKHLLMILSEVTFYSEHVVISYLNPHTWWKIFVLEINESKQLERNREHKWYLRCNKCNKNCTILVSNASYKWQMALYMSLLSRFNFCK